MGAGLPGPRVCDAAPCLGLTARGVGPAPWLARARASAAPRRLAACADQHNLLESTFTRRTGRNVLASRINLLNSHLECARQSFVL